MLTTQKASIETNLLQMGDYELPTNLMMEKQKVVIDQLRRKLDLDLDNFNKLS